MGTLLETLKRLLNSYKLLLAQKTKMGLLAYCEQLKGSDASPFNKVDSEVACAEVVSSILRHFIPDFPIITGTAVLDDYLKKHYKQVQFPKPGVVLVSPTGQGKFRNGHTGIVGENNVIYSNNSITGKLDTHWSVYSWAKHWGVEGKFPMNYYEVSIN